MPTTFAAEILADSVSPDGVRLTTLLVTMPRIILAEFNTHRVLSRNSASSRAIPIERRITAVVDDPFVPEAFGRNRRGMSATEDLEGADAEAAREVWLAARDAMVTHAERLLMLGVHKQWANRLVEPFSWHPVVVTATDWDNFLHQRISEDAMPEARRTAECIRDALAASTPAQLAVGEWHLPYIWEVDRYDAGGPLPPDPRTGEPDRNAWMHLARLSAARCARVSYATHAGVRDTDADLRLFTDTLRAKGHLSPMEHVAVIGDRGPQGADLALATPGWARDSDVTRRDPWAPDLLAVPPDTGNFRAPWIQLRKLVPGEADIRGAR